jgi:hypothetical protein
MIEEARLEPVESGLTPVTPGWFVVNTREVAWMNNEQTQACCIFESDDFVLRGRPDAPCAVGCKDNKRACVGGFDHLAVGEGSELLVPLRSKARSGERTLAQASVRGCSLKDYQSTIVQLSATRWTAGRCRPIDFLQGRQLTTR